MRPVVLLISLILASLSLTKTQAQQLVTGLTNETIFITSDFTGTELVIFGTINDMQNAVAGSNEEITVGRYDLVVLMEGPRKPGVVRKKEKAAGIWLNGDNTTFDNVPSSYLMLSTADETKPGFDDALKELRLGFDHMDIGGVTGTADNEEIEQFKKALVRLKSKDGLYSQEVGVEFLGDNLFRARITIPALVPVGTHQVQSYLLFDNKLISESSHEINVQKRSFEQAIFDFSRNYGYVYGVICVFIAMITGWLSSVVFRRD